MAKSTLDKKSFGKNSTNGLLYATNILTAGKAGTLQLYNSKAETTTKVKVKSINGGLLSKWKPADLNQYISTLPAGDTGIIIGEGSSMGTYNLVGSNGIKKSTITNTDGGAYPVLFNRGGVNEGVTGAAIFLRFINKSREDITETELSKFIMGPMAKEGHQGKIWGAGDNLGVSSAQKGNWPGVQAGKDDIWWEYGLKVIDAQALYDPDLWDFWKGKKVPRYTNKPSGGNMIQGALNYVNKKGGTNIRAWADAMYGNGVYNKVTVNAEGETGQAETKVDIRVTANNHNGVDETVDIARISAKFGGVGQFGQMSETNIWESTAKVMEEWFGIKRPAYTKTDWEKNMVTKDNMSDAAAAMRGMWAKECGVTYDKGTRDITNTSSNNLTDALLTKAGAENFKNILWKHLSQGKDSKAIEMGVTLVDNNKGDSHIYNLDALKLDEVFNDSLQVNFKVNKARKFSLGDEDLCSMIITMKDPDKNKQMEIVAIRVKRGDSKATGPFYRTIFEKKAGLTKAISSGSNIEDRALDPSKLKAL